MKSVILFAILLLRLLSYSQASTNKIDLNRKEYLTISVFVSNAKANDTLLLTFGSTLSGVIPKEYGVVTINKNGKFLFHIPVSSNSGYFQIWKMLPFDNKNNSGAFNSDILSGVFYWEKGDSITMCMNRKEGKSRGATYWSCNQDYSYIFSGHGSAKYSAKSKCDSAFLSVNRLSYNDIGDLFIDDFLYVSTESNQINAALLVLNRYKSKLSMSAFNTLKANYVFAESDFRFENIFQFFGTRFWQASADSQQLILSKLLTQENIYEKQVNIPDNDLSNSNSFSEYVWRKLVTFYNLRHHNYSLYDFNNDSIYYLVKSNFKGVLRNKLITRYLIDGWINPEHNNEIFADALQTVTSEDNYQKLENYFHATKIGSRGYNFNLPDMEGNLHSLEDYNGKIIVLDVWFTGCSSCITINGNVLSPVEEFFKNNPEVVFLSVCTDVNKVKWQNSVSSGRYTGLNCIKLYTGGQGVDHPIIKEYAISGMPTLILFDKAGKIVKYNTADLWKKDSLIASIEKILNIQNNN